MNNTFTFTAAEMREMQEETAKMQRITIFFATELRIKPY